MKCENTLMKDRELWTARGKHINVVRLPAVMLRDGVDTYLLCRSGVAFPGVSQAVWITRLGSGSLLPSCRPPPPRYGSQMFSKGGTTRLAPVVLASAALLVVAGCGGSAITSTSSAALPGSSTTRSLVTAASEPTCSDADDPRLQAVTLSDAGDTLTVEWKTQDLGTPGTVLWAVMATGQDGGIYQLAVKQIGTKAQSWVFDFGTAEQQEVGSRVGFRNGGGVSESFAYADMPDLGPTFGWKATLNIDGQDVAFCPGSGIELIFNR
jgi:hypothetical protein